MKTFLGLTIAAALTACSGGPGGTSAAGGSSGTPPTTGTGTGGNAVTTGGGVTTTGGAVATTGGEGTTGGQCQTSWPPRGCFAIATCECADGTEQNFGCIGPPTCGDACCAHGGPFTDAGLDDGGICRTNWPPRECDAEAICTCGDGTQQEFGCIGPPTCSDACCAHDGPGRNPPSDAGTPEPDGGVCQTWAPLPCDARFLCHCEDGMTEEAGCNGPPTCTAACCGHGGPPIGGGASDGGVCQTTWPPRGCLAEALCQCDDGTTQEFGCIGPPTCGEACCGHDGPFSDAGPVSPPDAGPGKDAGTGAGFDDDAGPVLIPGDAGLESDGGECPYWPPLACDAIGICHCGDGTTQYDACAGPPTCNDACCGHDGPNP